MQTHFIFIMQISSKDGNMVVDYYPVKDWDNTILGNRMLKVLSFRGDTQRKMIITKHEYDYQVKNYIEVHHYKVTDSNVKPPQFHNWRNLSDYSKCYKPYRTLHNY